MLDISRSNADKIGLDNMLLQTMEECGELVKAISKFNRSRGIGQVTEVTPEEAYPNMIIEIADLSICLEQLIYLMEIEEAVEVAKDFAFAKVAERYKNDRS